MIPVNNFVYFVLVHSRFLRIKVESVLVLEG